DSIQWFRMTMKEVSGLDPLNYIKLPSFAFDMAKKMTKVKLELFHKGQEDMHEFIQRWMRGGNSMAPHRLARANFPGMKGYNKRKANKWLLYLDSNNLYGWAIAWEVKLKYPDHLHPTYTEYPLCPERRIVKRQELGPHQNNDLIDKLSGGKFAETEKLVATLETKDRYIIHYRNLQQCLELGMKLDHVYRALEFDQSSWLKPYITANTI
ncbi:5839_t:CDS:2, partial [Funneliformis geosporum]